MKRQRTDDQIEPYTEAQQRMARMLGLHPDLPESWPRSLIDRLIWLQENRPRIDFNLEFQKIMQRL